MIAPYGYQYGFGLYIHWPYCSRICPYCDFNVYATKSSQDASILVDAIVTDIRIHHEFLPDHPQLNSVYFGGGTPSLLSANSIGQILKAARDTFGIGRNAEITLEANPNDVLECDIGGWESAGINRLSLGIQSLQESALKFLGRDHTASTCFKAIEAAMAKISSASVDLIYALPDQTLESWEEELEQVLEFNIDHLSLYELTFEEKTVFGKRLARGEITQPTEDVRADFYQLTDQVTKLKGMSRYEVSNHARTERARSKHNSIYWRGGDWLGVGPGAHGRITNSGIRYETEGMRKPAAYIESINTKDGRKNIKKLSDRDTSNELLMFGLRLKDGIEIERLENLGHKFDKVRLAEFQEAGLIRISEGRLQLTDKGYPLADAVGTRLAVFS